MFYLALRKRVKTVHELQFAFLFAGPAGPDFGLLNDNDYIFQNALRWPGLLQDFRPEHKT